MTAHIHNIFVTLQCCPENTVPKIVPLSQKTIPCLHPKHSTTPIHMNNIIITHTIKKYSFPTAPHANSGLIFLKCLNRHSNSCGYSQQQISVIIVLIVMVHLLTVSPHFTFASHTSPQRPTGQRKPVPTTFQRE